MYGVVKMATVLTEGSAPNIATKWKSISDELAYVPVLANAKVSH